MFVITRCGLDAERIRLRKLEKIHTFNRWHEKDPEDG